MQHNRINKSVLKIAVGNQVTLNTKAMFFSCCSQRSRCWYWDAKLKDMYVQSDSLSLYDVCKDLQVIGNVHASKYP